MSAVEELLKKILDYLDTNYPRSDDEPAFSTITQTVPGGSAVTITWTVRPEWKAKIKHLYVDAAPDCTYEWTLAGLTIQGNEVTFYRVADVDGGGRIQLVITNTGAADYDLDVLIEGWARRVVK